MNKIILQILVNSISFVFSFGLTLMIKPHVSHYVNNKIILNALQLLFAFIGYAVIYRVLNKKTSINQ